MADLSSNAHRARRAGRRWRDGRAAMAFVLLVGVLATRPQAHAEDRIPSEEITIYGDSAVDQAFRDLIDSFAQRG